MKKILITGVAGFIGYHLVNLLKEKYEIIGIDNINEYYSPQLKLDRLKELGINDKIVYGKILESHKIKSFKFYKINLEDLTKLEYIFKNYKFDCIINLAAQAGVRYSLENPAAYLNSNIIGFFNIIESAKKYKINKIIFASSSSVYGDNKKIPFSEDDRTDTPISFYAATKKCNEILAYNYYYLYNISMIGLRFFTVYGPWGRPDMAYFIFTDKILKGETITLFNEGKLRRDFTYIDDIIKGIELLLEDVLEKNITEFNIYNIGNNKPVNILNFVNILEEILGKKANIEYKPLQPGDLIETFADIDKLKERISFKPDTDIKEGLFKFVE